MPFKIVETVEKGQSKLTIVPSNWENKGLLRIPKIGASKFVRNEHSTPLEGWKTMKCRVKRQLISTYKEAEKEISEMEGKSDTDLPEEEHGGSVVQATHTNYNTMLEQLIHRQEEQIIIPGCSASGQDFQSLNDYHIVYEGGDITTESSHLPINTESQDIQNTCINFEEILDNQKKILENQKILLHTIQETQKRIIDKDDKNNRQIANLAVLIDDSFRRLNKNSSTVSLGNSSAFETKSFILKPVNSVKELEELENLLLDKEEKLRLEQQFQFLCSKTTGNGVSCSYKLLDILFSRDFLCKCSWSGGSRGHDTKIALKGFKNVLTFFYDMIHFWDSTYTAENNEKFFKIVTKNAVKRLSNKDIRASTKRKRQGKKVTENKKNKTESPQKPEGAEEEQKNQKIPDEAIENEINEELLDENMVMEPSLDVVINRIFDEDEEEESLL